jgi:hypothetical protein
MDSNSLNTMMQEGALRAVEMGKGFNVVLDNSFDSIEIVEKELNSLHAQIPRGFLAKLTRRGPSDKDIHLMAVTFGAYIGEILRKRYGAVWTMASKAFPNEQILTLHFDRGGGEIYPQIKVEKRLRLGEEENVWHYVQMLAQTLDATR